jgi:hypothetical protein
VTERLLRLLEERIGDLGQALAEEGAGAFR